MIPHGDGPSSYRLPEMTQDTPRITFQDNKNPENYFKAIRPGELKRIIDGDMSFFPIFQEYSTKLSHFTAESGARHGREAYQYAMRLGIPATVIYFAVDVDVMDYPGSRQSRFIGVGG